MNLSRVCWQPAAMDIPNSLNLSVKLNLNLSVNLVRPSPLAANTGRSPVPSPSAAALKPKPSWWLPNFDGKARGRGECVPYARYGESVDGVIAAIEAMRAQLDAGARPRRPATGDAAGCRPQCARLRVLGPGSQAQRHVRSGNWPGSRPARAHHRLYAISLRPPPDGRGRRQRPPAAPLLKVKLGGRNDLAAIRRASARCGRAAHNANADRRCQ